MTSPLAPTEPRTATSTGTGTPATRILGILTLVGIGWLVAFGLGFSPATGFTLSDSTSLDYFLTAVKA